MKLEKLTKKQYPLNTFKGETRKELDEYIDNILKETQTKNRNTIKFLRQSQGWHDGYKNGKIETKQKIIKCIENSECDGEDVNAILSYIKSI